MRKYNILFQQVFSQFISYRLHVISLILYNFIAPTITILALSQAQSISGVALPGIVNYYLILLLFLPILNVNVQDYISQLTTSGEINNFLMKPISLYKWILVKEISEKTVSMIFFIPAAIVLLWIFLDRTSLVFSPLLISQLIFSVVMCFILSFNFAFFIGIFSFWIDEFWTISNVKNVLVLLLGGIALPYVLFPLQINQILELTFFPYLVSWPTRVLTTGLQINEVVIAIVWLIISAISIHLFFGRAIKKYSFTAN